MEPKIREFFETTISQWPRMPKSELAKELAMWGVESGVIYIQGVDMTKPDDQKRFDREVEDTYSFLIGEAKQFIAETT